MNVKTTRRGRSLPTKGYFFPCTHDYFGYYRYFIRNNRVRAKASWLKAKTVKALANNAAPFTGKAWCNDTHAKELAFDYYIQPMIYELPA